MEIPDHLWDVVAAVAPGLVALRGVTGVGLGLREQYGEFYDELAVRVLVEDANDPPPGIPDEVVGLPVSVIEFAPEPLFAPDATCYPHLPGGAQIQPAPYASGTLGAIVEDTRGELVGLTCHHVVGGVGSPVWQAVAPPLVVGVPPNLTDCIGRVESVHSPQTQTIAAPAGPLLLLGRAVDAATISLDEARNQGRTISNAVLDGFGVVDATASPVVGQFVGKRGSQSGPTGGLTVGVHPIVPWSYATPPPGNTYVLSHQYEIFYSPPACPDGVFARGGDSGSVVFAQGTQTAVGLLWGGLQTGGVRAMMSDITLVEQRLGVRVGWSA